MTLGQYRALVAYLNYWTPMYPNMRIDEAIKDIGISITKEDVIHELFKAGWKYNEYTGLINEIQD